MYLLYLRLLYGVLSDGGVQVYGWSDRRGGRWKPSFGRCQTVNFIFFAITQTARWLGNKNNNNNKKLN